jgi:hypothetical protein
MTMTTQLQLINIIIINTIFTMSVFIYKECHIQVCVENQKRGRLIHYLVYRIPKIGTVLRQKNAAHNSLHYF